MLWTSFPSLCFLLTFFSFSIWSVLFSCESCEVEVIIKYPCVQKTNFFNKNILYNSLKANLWNFKIFRLYSLSYSKAVCLWCFGVHIYENYYDMHFPNHCTFLRVDKNVWQSPHFLGNAKLKIKISFVWYKCTVCCGCKVCFGLYWFCSVSKSFIKHLLYETGGTKMGKEYEIKSGGSVSMREKIYINERLHENYVSVQAVWQENKWQMMKWWCN